MASLIYDILLPSMCNGDVTINGALLKLMLVTSSYVPNKKTNQSRADVTNQVVGTGYTAGGQSVVQTVTDDPANDRVNITFDPVQWAGSTITARAGVIYVDNGGAPTGDILVAYVDFGSNISSTGGNFTVTFTAPLRLQN